LFAYLKQTKEMFPIGDDNSDRTITPIVNYLLILINIFVFVYWQAFGQDIQFTYSYATVPAEILSGHDIVTSAKIITDPYTGQQIEMPGLGITNIPVYLTLITSMFMHGSIAHIAGNMLYLWIFGDNLENIMGHTRYLIFYLLCGILAGLSHVFSIAFTNQSIYVPSLGASGAISGVLGGYMLQFPTRKVHIWLFFFFTIYVPAFIAVGFWFLFQVLSGTGYMGGQESSNVAYAAHIGGFIAGMVLVKLFTQRNRLLPKKRKSYW
jgi:membrane associated rhomboid family serine protease